MSHLKWILSFVFLLFNFLSFGQQESWMFKENNSTHIQSSIRTGQHGDLGIKNYSKYLFTGDTLVNNERYQIVKRKEFSSFNPQTQEHQYYNSNYSYFGLIRVDDAKKVFFIPLSDISDSYTGLTINEEALLYDFSINIGDTVHWKPDWMPIVASIDTIILDDLVERRVIIFHREPGWIYDTDIWIEGIGSSKGLRGSHYIPPYAGGPYSNLACAYDEQSNLIYDFWLNESDFSTFFDCLEHNINITEVENIVLDDIKIYPNPSISPSIFVESSYLMKDIISIEVMDTYGRIISKTPFNNYGTIHFKDEITLPNQAGIYWIVLELESNEKIMSRVVKI